MKDENRDFLSSCAKTGFGRIAFSAKQKAFYRRVNAEMLSLCRSLPEPVQTDSLLFLMEYSGVHLGDDLDFFANFSAPSWSVLYWLDRRDRLVTKRLKKRDVTSAVTAQSMAMFLHSLDDHLTDQELSVSHLSLLLRSQAWTVMNRAFCDLAENVPRGDKTVQHFIAGYYSSIRDSRELDSLGSYCDLFREQMGLGMIAPSLLSMKMDGVSDLTRDLQAAYGSFGIAWRLLDDIKDIGIDMEKGARSAICCCLPETLRSRWENGALKNRMAAEARRNSILVHIAEHGVVDGVRGRIRTELERAASMVEAHGLKGLGQEFRCLARPIRYSGRP